ncbi:hypothetical protein Tco_1499827 [Tanacetum coccineum]
MDGYVMPKYGNKNLFEDDSWIDIIMDDVYDTFYRDVEEEAKVAKASEDIKLSIMKEKFLAMVESEKAKVNDYTKLVVTDGMVDYVLEKYENKWKSEDEIAYVILEDLWLKYGKGKGKVVEDNGKGKEVDHHHLKVNKDNKGKGMLVEDNGKGKAKQVDYHDVHDLDTLDLENRFKKLEEDFGREAELKQRRKNEGRRLKRPTEQSGRIECERSAKKAKNAKAKLKKLSKGVKPLVKHHLLWVKSQKLKKRGKKQRKQMSSVKLGRNKDEGNLSEEHHDQDDHNHTAFVHEDFDATDADLERKSDETEEVIIEEEKDTSDVKSGDTEEFDLERIQSPSSPTQEEKPEEQFKDDELIDDIPFNISRPRGLSIPGPMQSQPQQPTQTTDPKEKGKGILVEEPKKKKLTLQQIRALETANDEEVARKVQAEWDAEEERKRLEDLKKPKPKTISKKPTSLTQERNHMMSFLKGQGYKNLQKLRYPQMKELYDKVQESIKDSFKDFIPMGSEKEKQMLQERDAKRLLRKRKATVTEEQPSKKLKLRTETIDELRNYLRIVDFEKSAQDRESLEAISMITEFKVIDSPDGEYLIIFRANNHFRAFNTLWEILHILDRQDLYHLYLVVQDYYKHIPPTGLGLILLGDLTTIWETSATSDDDFWKNQEDWEIIRWRLNESSGVHTLELEDGTMLHMLTERRYPLSRELMIRMLDHGMEVEDESETAITLIHLFILWTTEDGDDS